jgi:hypothetical protein
MVSEPESIDVVPSEESVRWRRSSMSRVGGATCPFSIDTPGCNTVRAVTAGLESGMDAERFLGGDEGVVLADYEHSRTASVWKRSIATTKVCSGVFCFQQCDG